MTDLTQERLVSALARFSALALGVLADAREEIDALNVYPVPDGDTGTNLFLTFEAAHDALMATLAEQGGPERAGLAGTSASYARALLLGARGNSGVIASQLAGALLRHLGTAGADDHPGEVFARGLAAATQAAYAAVAEPVEGTMLTVARAASDAAAVYDHDPDATLGQVLETASRAAREALSCTPDQLPVLAEAGVVDAGGAGLCLLLEAAESAWTGRRLRPAAAPRTRRPVPVPLPTGDLTEQGPSYEVMYLLDAEDDAVPALRGTLAGLGDSVVVVGGEGLWNVHVHVDDVGAAVEAGIAAGRPHRIRVTHFAEQTARAAAAVPTGEHAGRPTRRVVTLAFGAGMAAILQEAGGHVVPTSAEARPSTGDLLEAVLACGAHEVVVLPNDRDVLPAAEAAARLARSDHHLRVAVVPTHTQVQGMAALAVHDPGRDFDQDIVEMAAAARHARSGAVTVAVRSAITTGGRCEPGDTLGEVEGDFVVVGADLYDTAVEVIDRLLGGGGELFTLVGGEGGKELAQRCEAYLGERYPTVDVLVYDGGQDRYPLLMGVE